MKIKIQNARRIFPSIVASTVFAMLLGMFYLPGAALAQAQPSSCQFILGFKTLHDLVPQEVGECVDNQAYAANGDAQQHTSNGLMAWRKADNWTAFTNGYKTWINGPNGLVSRLNTDRFPWENDAPAAPAASPAPPPVPADSGPLPDISGPWLLENNQTVYIVDEDFDGYILMQPSQMRQCTASGQSVVPPNVDAKTIKSPMNRVFFGNLSGTTVTGYWLVCATINQSWVPMSIVFTLSPDGNHLTGQLQETLTLDRI